ncbi:protein kinase [Myxococcaceae bacterium GXIMD 01537]
MTATLMGLPAGASIDGWNVVKELGNGGFAVVFLGEKNGKHSALKVARHREASGDERKTHARVLREVTALLMLSHPNIIRHRGYGYAEAGNVYLALEYVDGWTLAEWKERKHPTVREVVKVFEKLAAALAYMHGRGVLHRDLKLPNVLIRKSDGEPIIIDFSCATYTLAEELTDGGLPPGTDRFRAPEQFTFLRQHREEPRARYAFQVADEVFALGAMLYELLTDPRPTEVRARLDLNYPLAKPPAPRDLNPRVPEVLSDLVEDMLSREPAKRPVDTEALRREFAELLKETGAEYLEPVHSPSERSRAEAPGRTGAVALASPSQLEVGTARGVVERIRGSRKWLLAGAAAVVTLAAAVALWLLPGEPPEPRGSVAPTSPGAPVSAPPPAMSPPTPGPGATGPAIAAAPKEGSTVQTPAPEAPTPARSPRGQKKATTAVDCAKLSLLAALAAGCPGAQVRQGAFTCPADAVRAMREMFWDDGNDFSITLDERYPRGAMTWFAPGSDVVGVVSTDGGKKQGQRGVAPNGTRFYGRVFLTDRRHYDDSPQFIVRYDRVKLPGQDVQPICLVVEGGVRGSEDGRVLGLNANRGTVAYSWPVF